MIDEILENYINKYINRKPYIKTLGEKLLRNKSLIIEKSYNLLNTNIDKKIYNCLIKLINILNETPSILIDFEISKTIFGNKFGGDSIYNVELNIDLNVESLYSSILSTSFKIEQYEGNGNIKINNYIYPDTIFLDIHNAILKKEEYNILFNTDLKEIIINYNTIVIVTNDFSEKIDITQFNRELLAKPFKKLNNYVRNLYLL